jgi:hypothetical protein
MNFIDTQVVNKYQEATVSAIITGIVLLVSLAWNDLIKTFIKKYFPAKDDNTVRGKFIYAMIITFLVIILQIYLFPILNPDYEI